MVNRRKALSLIFSQDHCQRFSPLQIPGMPQAGFEPVQNLSSVFVEWSCAVVITTTPQRHYLYPSIKNPLFLYPLIHVLCFSVFEEACNPKFVILPPFLGKRSKRATETYLETKFSWLGKAYMVLCSSKRFLINMKTFQFNWSLFGYRNFSSSSR